MAPTAGVPPMQACLRTSTFPGGWESPLQRVPAPGDQPHATAGGVGVRKVRIHTHAPPDAKAERAARALQREGFFIFILEVLHLQRGTLAEL